VIGDPVKHSLSPKMHNAAFKALGMNAVYEAVHVLPSELPEFVKNSRSLYDGVNVTVPHKGPIMKYLDKISALANLAGSVNTITNIDGKLFGDSTDGKGLEAAFLEDFGMTVPGESFFFVGCGGACRAVAVYFASIGARKLSFVNRTISKAEELCSLISGEFPSVDLHFSSIGDDSFISEHLGASDLVIQSSSVGLKPNDPSPLSSKYFFPDKFYYDMIYGHTSFLDCAKKMGCRYSSGLSMLIHQGAESFRIWTGRDAPVKAMRTAIISN